MARFSHIYEEHIDLKKSLWKYLRNILLIPFSLIIAWIPIVGVYEVSCKLGESGIETTLTRNALEVEQRVRLKRHFDESLLNRVVHEFEETIEFYALLK